MHILTRDNVLAADTDLARIATATDGFSGSDLKSVCLTAALSSAKTAIAAKSSTATLTNADFDKALLMQKASVAPNAKLQRDLHAWYCNNTYEASF